MFIKTHAYICKYKELEAAEILASVFIAPFNIIFTCVPTFSFSHNTCYLCW